jgi:Flp pilus assembly protein TadB
MHGILFFPFFFLYSWKRRWEREKKFGPFLDLCVSSLRRGHANLLCIVPILSDVSEETEGVATELAYIAG